ncbi:peptide ABC transporter substrate-binding protein [Carnobacterium mobile]|uniref:peptide ABC transporter substrate-binding protein n=1 Tax=Carnobacterium mobile TaxID=2750 RepID=UPI001867EF98|nr:peptide ABC transporter substrate-binding protein [Carnobacterium mobile]
MKNIKLMSLLGITLVSSAVLAACGSNTEGSKGGSTTQELNLIETAEIPTMDSVLNTDTVGSTVMNNVMEGLYRLNLKNEPELAMAAEVPTISEDGLTYTFKIREDANWSNGEPVTANDFVFAWRRLVNPETGSQSAYMMEDVIKNATEINKGELKPEELGVKEIDDKTLEIQLVAELPYFKDLLSLSMFLPQNEDYVTEKGNKYASSSDNALYNGPFVLTKWDGTGLSWSYEKNDTYWDAETVKLDEINVDVVKETSTAINLYDAGEIDSMKLTGEYVQTKQGDPDLKSAPTSSVFYFKYNQERNGQPTPLANENIRKAISMAFDKEAYAKTILQNGSLPANGLVPSGIVKNPSTDEDFRDENGDLLIYDKEAAKEYMKKGLAELGVDSLKLELLSDDSENAKKSSEYMQGQLMQNLPGLEINIRSVPFKVRIDVNSRQDYDIQMAGWGADFADPINFLELFETTNSNNKASISIPEYDALLEKVNTTDLNDLDKRWSDMIEAEKLLLDQAAIAPIYQRYNAILEKPYVKNIGKHLVGPEYSFKWASIEK